MPYRKLVGALGVFLGLCALVPAAAAAEDLDLDRQFTSFYQEKNYALAPELIAAYLTRYPAIDAVHRWPAAFFFSRILTSEAAYSQLEGLYAAASPAHRAFLLDVIYLKTNPVSKRFLVWVLKTEGGGALKDRAQRILDHEDFTYDPMVEEITDSNQLDMLWTVFLTSGDVAPVGKIASVLDWPDIVRTRLAQWTGSAADRSEAAELLARFGVQVEGQSIADGVDTDIRIVQKLQRGELSPEFRRLRTLLGVTDPEIYKMALKGAAFWSLRSNAQQHELVLAECQRLASEGTGPGTTMLKILLASLRP